jgi:hypothetical protein
MRLRILIVVAGLLVASVSVAASAARHHAFSRPVKLTGPAGGEPSIATDPLGDVFVVSPQGVPAGATGHAGVGYWVSRNDGKRFSKGIFIGSFLGGGDDDVIVSKGVVYVDDLEATSAEICKSTDHGRTFESIGPTPDPDHCSHIGVGQAGPSDDRPWLTADRRGTLYLTYHEFVTAQPVIDRSDNGGGDLFGAGPCGPIVSDPKIEANVPQDVTGGTLVARPVTDAAGSVYILFATSTQQEDAAAAAVGQPSGTFSQLYVAVSHDRCKSFTDYTVFDGSKLGTNTVQFGDIFNDLAIDGAGNLYAIGTGFVGRKAFAPTANVYLLRSFDHGTKWRAPILLGSTASAHMLPAAVGGLRAGQLAIGYYRTINRVRDPGSTSGRWTYSTAETTNATAARPRFVYHDVQPGFVYHKGDICNLGVICGTVPGQPSDRSLLDFTSVALDRHGCPLFAFAGNPQGDAKGTSDYVTRQRLSCFRTRRR